MSKDPESKVMDHEADGITELDNNLPTWWVWLFWGAIIWGVLYLLHFHVFKMGPGSAAEFKQEVAAADTLKKATVATAAANSPAEAEIPLDQVQPLTDAAALALGEATFTKNCVVCHGAMAQGLIGPNLNDAFWIHGGEFKNIVNTIREGVPVKGMITWRGVLKHSDIIAVASYIWTLQGRDVSKAIPPPKPVEPEAKEYKRPS